jgi:hypothetical protein
MATSSDTLRHRQYFLLSEAKYNSVVRDNIMSKHVSVR